MRKLVSGDAMGDKLNAERRKSRKKKCGKGKKKMGTAASGV